MARVMRTDLETLPVSGLTVQELGEDVPCITQ